MSGDLLEAPENKAKWYECDEIYIVGGNSVSQKIADSITELFFAHEILFSTRKLDEVSHTNISYSLLQLGHGM